MSLSMTTFLNGLDDASLSTLNGYILDTAKMAFANENDFKIVTLRFGEGFCANLVAAESDYYNVLIETERAAVTAVDASKALYQAVVHQAVDNLLPAAMTIASFVSDEKASPDLSSGSSDIAVPSHNELPDSLDAANEDTPHETHLEMDYFDRQHDTSEHKDAGNVKSDSPQTDSGYDSHEDMELLKAVLEHQRKHGPQTIPDEEGIVWTWRSSDHETAAQLFAFETIVHACHQVIEQLPSDQINIPATPPVTPQHRILHDYVGTPTPLWLAPRGWIVDENGVYRAAACSPIEMDPIEEDPFLDSPVDGSNQPSIPFKLPTRARIRPDEDEEEINGGDPRIGLSNDNWDAREDEDDEDINPHQVFLEGLVTPPPLWQPQHLKRRKAGPVPGNFVPGTMVAAKGHHQWFCCCRPCCAERSGLQDSFEAKIESIARGS